MSTGIIGTLAISSSLTYTPTTNAKIIICASYSTTSPTVSINGVVVLTLSSTYAAAMLEIFAAAGVPVVIATGAGATAIVSALEQ